MIISDFCLLELQGVSVRATNPANPYNSLGLRHKRVWTLVPTPPACLQRHPFCSLHRRHPDPDLKSADRFHCAPLSTQTAQRPLPSSIPPFSTRPTVAQHSIPAPPLQHHSQARVVPRRARVPRLLPPLAPRRTVRSFPMRRRPQPYPIFIPFLRLSHLTFSGAGSTPPTHLLHHLPSFTPAPALAPGLAQSRPRRVIRATSMTIPGGSSTPSQHRPIAVLLTPRRQVRPPYQCAL